MKSGVGPTVADEENKGSFTSNGPSASEFRDVLCKLVTGITYHDLQK